MPTHNTVIHTTMMPIRAPLSSNVRKTDDQNEALPRIRQKQDKNKPSQPPRQQPETYRELLEQEYSVAAAQRDGLIDLHGELRNLQESGAPIDWSKIHPAALARISEMAAQFPDATGHSVMTMPASNPEEAERAGAMFREVVDAPRMGPEEPWIANEHGVIAVIHTRKTMDDALQS